MEAPYGVTLWCHRLPSTWRTLFILVRCDAAYRFTLKTAHLKNTLAERWGGGLGALGARTRTPRKIWINFGAPPRVAPLTSPPGAPQRQLSVTGTDRTLDCPCVTWIWSLERGRSVRGYPTHVPDPLSSFAHAAWRFLKVAPLPRGIGADSFPCRSTGFVTFSGSLGSAKTFRGEPRAAR